MLVSSRHGRRRSGSIWTASAPGPSRTSSSSAAEPDERYIILSRHKTRPKVPDFAIEVVFTTGGIEKLEIYRLLGVREIWFWEDGELHFHVLRGKHYVRARRSTLLPSLDPALITRFMSGGTQPEAVRALRRTLRTPRRTRA